MKIETVLTNLDRTIEGKELFLSKLSEPTDSLAIGFVKLNLDELRRIHADLVKVKKSLDFL